VSKTELNMELNLYRKLSDNTERCG